MSYGKVYIFEHFAHHEITGIPPLVEFVTLCNAEFVVVPRNVAEITNLEEVEICPEEASHGLIFRAHGLVVAVAEVVEHIVDIAERAPLPASTGRRDITYAPELHRKSGLEADVALLIEERSFEKVRVECVGNILELCRVLEVGI